MLNKTGKEPGDTTSHLGIMEFKMLHLGLSDSEADFFGDLDL